MKLFAGFKSLLLGAGLAGLLAMLPSAVFAHSSLTASLPGNQTVVSSPERLELTFNEGVRMLRLTLVHGASHNIEFGFQPSTDVQNSHGYALPQLMMGEHTVSWTVIGGDGHPVSGTFKFSVSPDGEAAQSQAAGGGHHHH